MQFVVTNIFEIIKKTFMSDNNFINSDGEIEFYDCIQIPGTLRNKIGYTHVSVRKTRETESHYSVPTLTERPNKISS